MALNWLNFFAADVSDGVGPFLAVYLASNLQWSSSHIGMAIAATQLSMVIGQSPAGFVVDRTRRKRLPILLASAVVGSVALLWPALRGLGAVLVCQVALGLAASFYIPTLVSLAASLSGKGGFDRTISKNQSYNHAGNVASAVLTGVVARFTNNAGIFYCMAGFSVFCTITALCIKPSDVAPPKPAQQVEAEKKSIFREVLGNKIFLVFLMLVTVFYLSNGAMLPLVAQVMAKNDPKNSTLYLASGIIIAQAVMVPTVWACGKLAGKGRKKLLAVAFMLLAVRGAAYMVTDNVVYLLSLQVLDGMAAGTFSVVAIMVVNDLMGESERASFAQGLLAAALSLGSMVSNLIGGFVVDLAGFPTGFLVLSALAVASLLLLWKVMPETVKRSQANEAKSQTSPPLQDFAR